MKTAVFYHPAFQKHDTGRTHPESPHRLEAVLNKWDDLPFVRECERVEAPMIDEELAQQIHDAVFVSQLKSFCAGGGGYIDMDTIASTGSWEAALRAAGAAIEGVKCIIDDDRPSFSLVRPPGHHALPNRSMGFCLLNNAAFAVDQARKMGINRILVFDWDAHHGNGDQAFFESDPNVLYVSMHQSPLYPGTGWLMETGIGSGVGTVINIPLPPGAGDSSAELMMTEIVDPILDQFKPELTIIEAGFDSHHRDPLANLQLTTNAYAMMAKRLADVTPRPLMALLEGGYDLSALPYCIDATIAGMLNHDYIEPASLGSATEASFDEVKITLKLIKKTIARDDVFHL